MRTNLALHYHVDGNDIGYVSRTLVAAWAVAAQDAARLRERGYRVTGQHGDYDADHGEDTYCLRTVSCVDRACLRSVDESERWWVEDPETGELHMLGWEPPVRQRQRRRAVDAKPARTARYAAYCTTLDGRHQRRLELTAATDESGAAMLRNIAQRNALVLHAIVEVANSAGQKTGRLVLSEEAT